METLQRTEPVDLDALAEQYKPKPRLDIKALAEEHRPNRANGHDPAS